MAIDITSPRSRRSLITTVLGGVAAAAAATLTGAQRVLAAGNDGDAVLIGQAYSDVRTATIFTAQSENSVDTVLVVQGEGSNSALKASTSTGKGVFGLAFDNGWGVLGSSTAGTGVHGTSGDAVTASLHYPAAVLGETKRAAGVSILGNNYATSGFAQGVQGSTSSPRGLATTGWAMANGTALVGVSGPDFPSARIPVKAGVYGYAEHGRGVVAEGSVSQLRLVPASGSHPSSGQAGDLFMDRANKLWLCKGGTSWHQLG